MSRLALLVAGFPASGKSLLLRHALSADQPIFGRYSTHQKGFRPVPSVIDYMPRRVIGDHYVHFEWINDLLKDANFAPPDILMVHVDLASAVKLRDDVFPYSMYRNPRFLADCLDETMATLVNCYEEIVVNTVHAPLQELANRYLQRQHRWKLDGWGATNLDELYRTGDEDTFSLVSKACADHLKRVAAYRVRTDWLHGHSFTVTEEG
jgi:hypothetical protein